VTGNPGFDDTDGVLAVARAVRSGERSAVDVIAAHLDAAAHAQGTLNAFTLIDHDRALAAADQIDMLVAGGEDPGPLAGVPIAVKDLIAHQGRPTTNGGGFPAEIPDTTAPCIARLERAGAVILGRVGLHEFAFGFSSENHWFGPVRNPWDPALSPGGSSGGSAAAVAAGLAAAALGTDTGGSVRVPAALCGVVGLKVTHGRVPLTGVTPLAASLDTVGPLARSVADAAAVYGAIAGDDPTDPWSMPQPVVMPAGPADLEGVRIGVPVPWTRRPLAAAVGDAFAAALEALRAAGAEVTEVDAPDLDPPGLVPASLYPEVAAFHGERLAADPAGYGPEMQERLAVAKRYTHADYLAGLEWRHKVTAAMARALSGRHALATPATPVTRKVIGVDNVDVAGNEEPHRIALGTFTSLVNHALLPAIVVPLPGAAQPPPGLQLIGAAWSEHRLLELGLALEEAGIARVQRPPHWRP
jgi:Asp-tRNA(Asn)/Glu-tRNA(Gln) amidotransferase A subunit family amidase